MAIIVVLAAIAIPTFGKQLETARESADAEAIRAAATNAFSQAYTGYVTGKYTASTLATTAFTGDEITPKQTNLKFEYIQPSIAIGGTTITMSGGTTISGGAVEFFFEENSETGGIQIAAIQFAGSNSNKFTYS